MFGFCLIKAHEVLIIKQYSVFSLTDYTYGPLQVSSLMLFLNCIKEISCVALSVLQGKKWEHVLNRNIVLHQGLGEKEKEERRGDYTGQETDSSLGKLQRKSSGAESRAMCVPQPCSCLPALL